MPAWSTEEWIRFFEILAILTIDGFSVWAITQNLYHIIFQTTSRLFIRWAVGRIFRHLGVITWSIGILQSTIQNFDNALTLRSVTWMTGAWFLFLAWNFLDRDRWVNQ